MKMPFEGEPTLPQALFWSGDEVTVLRIIDVIKGGVPHKKLFMILSDQVKWRYPNLITDKTLNYDITDVGVFIKSYPASYFKFCDNPETPWYIILCNFDGSIGVDHDVQISRDKLVQLQNLITTLKQENHVLRQELKTARMYLDELGVNR